VQRRAAAIIATVVILLSSLTARAADEWVLTTADFRSDRVTLRGIDERGVTVVPVASAAGGQGRQVGFDRMLQLERIGGAKPVPTSSARFVLVLQGDERIAGEPKALEGETLVWTSPSLGEIKLPLARVRAMAQPKQLDALASADRAGATEDVITLVNGDTVRGIIAAIDGSTISVQSAGGDKVDVPLGSVSHVQLAKVAGAQNANPSASAQRGFRVTLADSTTISAPSLSMRGQQLSLRLDDGAARSVPVATVTSIEQVNGPVVWLSLLPPSENVQTPFLKYSAPAQMNRTTDGEPIRFGDHAYARGIGVHAYSRLTWPIDPAYRAFRTQYAIDGQLPYANVTVRIKLDDHVAHEQKDFRAGTLSPVVMLDTKGAKTITLEVDMGETYDVQDRFNWIEPALLKEKPAPPPPPPAPAPAPTTAPTTTPSTRPATQPTT
jgi:hypothetical protein